MAHGWQRGLLRGVLLSGLLVACGENPAGEGSVSLSGGGTGSGADASSGGEASTGGESGSGGQAATGAVTSSGGEASTGGFGATGGSAAVGSGKPCEVPAEARAEDVSNPDHVVGSGTPESCTGQAFIDAVAQGGVITFDCGPDPVIITLTQPAKIFNDASDEVVIDGGGLVTLSGGGTTRILYMNTCDQNQHWTTPMCQNQDHPRLSLQNLTFADGNSSADSEYAGGGAVWVRGGKVKVIGCTFRNNRCADTGPDLAGAGLYVLSPYNNEPVYVVDSVFGGAPGAGNHCANGGAIGSIGVSWTILNSVMSHNRAVGNGGNPAQAGTPGGGSGGAVYNDGQTMTLTLCGTLVEENEVNAFGSGLFFISNNHDGTLHIERSTLRNNHGGSWYALPNVSMHDDTRREIIDSVLE